MHRLAYRDAIWREVDHAPGGSGEAVHRTNKDIERALYQLFSEAPYLFRVESRNIYLDADIEMEDAATDFLEVAEDVGPPAAQDGWVLQTRYNTSSPLAAKWLTGPERLLDGRILRITDPDDPTYYHYFRIREVWTEAPDPAVPADIRVRISLRRPIDPAWYAEDLKWRVLTSEYAIPNDIIRMKDISVDIDGRTYPVAVEHEGVLEDRALTDHSHDLSNAGGRPFTAYRRQAEGVRRPIVPAVITVNPEQPAGSWDTANSPLGEFEYFWTISMGFRVFESRYGDPENISHEDFVNKRLKPYWESAPSPVSDSAVVPTDTTTVTLRFPDLQRLIGFADSSTIRHMHTGIWINIYRRRVSADAAGISYASEHAYYVDRIKADGVLTWTDDGSKLPAHTVPLRENTKYQTLRFHPFPDEKYRIRMRSYIRPLPPKDDYEDVPIPDDAQNAIIYLAAQHFYRRAGNAAFAAHYQQLYMDTKALLARTYGQAKPRKRPARRGLARVRRSRGGGTHRKVPLGLVRNV